MKASLVVISNSASPMEEAIRPVFVVSGIFGCAPLLKGTKNSEIFVIYRVFLGIFLLVCASFASMVLPEYLILYTSMLKLSLCRFEILINNLTAVFSIVSSLTSRNTMTKVLKDLASVDGLLHIYGVRVSYSYKYYLYCTILKLLFISIGTILSVTENTATTIFVKAVFHLSLVLPIAISQLVEFQYIALLHTIGKRFLYLIDKLAELKGKQVSTSKQGELEVLVKIYNRLIEDCNFLNDIYGKQLLFIVGTIFIMTTANANNVVEGIIAYILGSMDATVGVRMLIIFAYFAALRLLEVWSVITICENVTQQAKNFSSSLYQYMIEESLDTCKNKKLRLHLTLQREPSFSACGFFPLDFTLLHSIVAAATTYLVILIQFSQSSSSSQQNSTNPTPRNLQYFEGNEISNDTLNFLLQVK